jgi:hypothetical protein
MASAAAAGFLHLPSPSSLCSYLNSRSSSCTPLCARSTPTYALEHQFHRRRHLCITSPSDAVGGVLHGPILSFPERNRIPHVTLVVQGKPSPGSRSVWSLGPRPPERRPSRRRRQISSPAPSLRFLARLLLLHTVSKNPCSISLSLVHFGALTSSPEQPRRPLPAPVADEARSPPLTPRSRAHAPPLRFALACGRVDGRERRPGATPASPHRAPPLSGDAAAASRSHAS